MLAALALSLTLASNPQQVVQVPVDDPRLPEGPLELVAGWDAFRLYIDPPSWRRSDIENLVRGTAIIVAPESRRTLQVVLAWVDCGRRVYQLSSGRAYDASGTEIAATLYVPDRPVGETGPMKQLADRVCGTPDAPQGPSVADWRNALEEARTAVASAP
jgi:hypothetical protein